MIIPRPQTFSQGHPIFMIVSDNLVLQAKGGGALAEPDSTQILRLWGSASYHAQIGEYAEKPVYLLVMEKTDKFDEFEFKPLRQLLTRVDAELFALAGRACQVAYFIRTHNYCSHCGDELVEVTDELAVYCKRCDYRTYPRISPCIIVAVYRNDGEQAEVLLARGERHPPGVYSILAGFVESGESLEQTVVREVYEETQIRVSQIEYVESQSWPFPHSLMAGFVACYQGGELQVDGVELIEGGWFKFSQLPQTPPAGTIAATLIEHARQRAKA